MQTKCAHAPWASYNTPYIELIQCGRRIGKKVYCFWDRNWGAHRPAIGQFSSLFLVTVPDAVVKVYSSQSPSRF